LTLIATIRRGKTALSALTYLYDRAAQETGEPLRLIDGDCHGTPMRADDEAALAEAVQVSSAGLDGRPQLGRPIMLCTISSDPGLPSPTDEEWAGFSRRLLGAASLLSDGDRQGCRWVALRSAERRVHIVASLVHDDGRPARSLRNLSMVVLREYQSILAEYSRQYYDDPVTKGPTAQGPARSGELSLDDQLLDLTDRIRAARTGTELRACVEQLVHPDNGVLERVREALEAVGEQVTDLDEDAHQLGDRFAIASDFVTAAEGELAGAIQEVARIGGPGPAPDPNPTHKAALATSPPATSSPAPAPSAPQAPPAAGPVQPSPARRSR
jgi:hypothetical protein